VPAMQSRNEEDKGTGESGQKGTAARKNHAFP